MKWTTSFEWTGKSVLCFASLLIMSAMLVFLAPGANATTNAVLNTADSGPASLRDALGSAADGDTINITASGTITLLTGELLIANNVTIVGPGPAALAIDGNFPTTTNRVFDISPDKTVTIASLTITNGNFVGGSGGGIYNYHATLTV